MMYVLTLTEVDQNLKDPAKTPTESVYKYNFENLDSAKLFVNQTKTALEINIQKKCGLSINCSDDWKEGKPSGYNKTWYYDIIYKEKNYIKNCHWVLEEKIF